MNKLTSLTYNDSTDYVTSYTYDGLRHPATRLSTIGSMCQYTSTYTYTNGDHGTDSTTTLVKGINQPDHALIYTYFTAGTIAAVTYKGNETSYKYDALGQMLRENNQAAGSTWVYTYNQGGNILTKMRYAYTVDTVGTALESISYTYGDANWKDKLTKHAGKTITYDAIGNPLTYAGYQYTWQAGRQLAAIAGNGITAQYTYNESGLRIKKVVNGEETAYTLNGKHIVHLKKGGAQLHFYHDVQGRPSHLVSGGYANVPEVKYVYVYNLQGGCHRAVECQR